MIRTVMELPENFCIYNSMRAEGVIKFLGQLEHYCLNNEPVLLDLRNVQFISAAASLLLFSCVSKLQITAGNANIVRCQFPRADKNPNGHKLIVRTGLSKALNSGTLEKLHDLSLTRCLYQSSADPDEHCISTSKLLTESLSTQSSSELALMLTAALSEAMLNVKHHAYEDRESLRQQLQGYRWWQCAWFNREKSRFVFIIHDLGSGIANTYRQGKHADRGLTDSQLIAEALSPGGTRFQESHRGNGSEDIKAPVGENETLLVYSGNVRYIYQGNTGRAQMETHLATVPGTLVEWSLTYKGGQS